MRKDGEIENLERRIMQVIDDLRVIQQELNCAAMQAPSDPELMEALNALPQTETIQLLRSSLDQMRHFLWFYAQIVSNEPDLGEEVDHVPSSAPAHAKALGTSFLDKLTLADEAILLGYLAQAKDRKPN